MWELAKINMMSDNIAEIEKNEYQMLYICRKLGNMERQQIRQEPDKRRYEGYLTTMDCSDSSALVRIMVATRTPGNKSGAGGGNTADEFIIRSYRATKNARTNIFFFS